MMAAPQGEDRSLMSGMVRMPGVLRLPFVGAAILLWVTAAFTQGPDTLWTKTYGEKFDSDYAYSVAQTSDGGYVIAGTTKPFLSADEDVYLLRTDSNGDTLWTRRYGGADDDQGQSVRETADGGYIIAGWTESFGVGLADFYVIRTTSNGDTIWTRRYGGSGSDYACSIDEVTGGGYIIGGYTDSFGSIDNDWYLVKIDAGGDTVWTKTYGGAAHDECRAVLQTADGGYITAGATSSFGAAGYDAYFIKTDANGDSLWTRVYGGGGADRAYSLDRTPDGGYIIAGYTGSFGAGVSDVYLIRLDMNGDTLWTRTYGGSEHDGGYSVRQVSSGGYVVTGYTESYGAGGYDVYVIRTDSGGDTLWTRTFGGARDDHGRSVLETTDYGYIIAGDVAHPTSTKADVYLIKIGPDCSGIDGNQADWPALSTHLARPNPFRDMTLINYSLRQDAAICIRVYNPAGQEVRTLVNGVTGPGDHLTFWDGKDNIGRRVAGGMYLLRFEVAGTATTSKLILIR
jgi:hypothetical protein